MPNLYIAALWVCFHVELTPRGYVFTPSGCQKLCEGHDSVREASGEMPSPFAKELIRWFGSLIQLETATEVPALDEPALSLPERRGGA